MIALATETETETETGPSEDYVRAVRTAAYHLGLVMTEAAPCTVRCGIGGSIVEVTIEPCGHDPIWDQCTVNGQWRGNRCGGRSGVAEVYAAELYRMALAEVTRG